MSMIEQWVEQFRGFGARPSPERYAALFDPEGTVFDPGMERPLPATEVTPHMAGILKLMPDLHFTIARWRAQGDTVFVEAHNSATVAGQKMLWDAVYCVRLREGRVIRGRRYYDRVPLLARMSPTFPALPPYDPVVDQALDHVDEGATPSSGVSISEFLERYRQLWQAPVPQAFAAVYHPCGRMWNPGMGRPIRRAEIPGYYTSLFAAIPDLRMQRLAWAGDQHVLYIEWQANGHLAGKPLRLNVIDCFEFIDGHVIYGTAYFDTVVLLRVLDPSINAVHFALSTHASVETSHS
jgi:ketosteroid isomerase-like protein